MRKGIFAFTNQKGGVGKTTSCVNIASCLAEKYKVLLIDLDPQGNATTGSGINKNGVEYTINDVLQGDVSIKKAIVRNKEIKYSVVAGNSDLTVSEVNLLNAKNRSFILSKAIDKVAKDFDFVFIDCPPSLNVLTLNALVAAEFLVIPIQCEYYALEGLTSLLDTVKQIQSTVNKKLKIFGIIRTMYDVRNKLALQVSEQLIKHFGKSLVFKTVIPRNVRLAEAPSYGVPINVYDKSSIGYTSYLKMSQELLKKYKSLSKKKQEA